MEELSTSTDEENCAETSSKFRLVIFSEKEMLRMPFSMLQISTFFFFF